MEAIAVIPARGGSKRIPGKNIKKFLDSPLITYPISSLLETNMLSDVVVSTDSEEIAKIARTSGASVPYLRESQLSGDHVSTLDVVKDSIAKLRDLDQSTLIICAYPAAILDVETWKRFITRSKSNEATFTVTVGRMRNAPERALRYTSDGRMSMANPLFAGTRSQDLPENFYDAGKAYAATVAVWMGASSILGSPFNAFELDYTAAQDLDTLGDWSIAERLLKASN